MAATIKDSVYKAIDVIVGKRIEDLHLDKTIEATVEQCLNLSTGKYRLRYGSGLFDAYAGKDDVYMPNTAVYVLIPENDFSRKKTIIGQANTGTQTNTDELQSITSLYSGYSIVGKNIISPIQDGINRFDLKSWDYVLPEDDKSVIENGIILYDANQNPKYNLLQIDNERLKIYLEEAQGFLFSGKFKTNLSHRNLTGREDYGLIFNVALKNGKTSFANMQERWDAQEPKTICNINITDNQGNIIAEEKRLNDYRVMIEDILFPSQNKINTLISFYNQSIEEIVQNNLYNLVYIELQTFISALTFVDAETLELVNLYSQLINDLINYTINIHDQPIKLKDIQEQYNDWFTNTSYAFQEEEYSIILDTNHMTGDVYHFNTPTYQYSFAEIDPATFVRVNSIFFYYKNFKPDASLAAYGSDIRVQDVSIVCIKYLDNINGDYRLDLEYEDIYFSKNASDTDTLNITAKISYKEQDITDYSQIMWFKKNNNITSDSAKYSIYAGAGWEHIAVKYDNYGFNKSPILTVKTIDNPVYRNKYKVIAMYESSTIVQQEFIIYNDNYKHNIELISDSGTAFGEGSGSKQIVCTVDGDRYLSPEKYQCVWYKELIDGTRYRIRDIAGIEQLKNEIEDVNNVSITDRQIKKIELAAISSIQWDTNSNSIIVNAAAVPNNSYIKIICAISSNINDEYLVDLGETDITLTSGYTVALKNYYIEIVNGNQVFQYNESGISPSSNIYENPLVPEKLTCNFYDPNGGLINPLRYTVSWQIPLTNTLINTDNSVLSYNITTDQYDLLQSDSCSFVIQDEYDYTCTNNQIICIVEFDDGSGLVNYRQLTNFFFGKIGDDGTNGTDVVAKIDIAYNDHQNLNSNYNNNTLLYELLTLKIEQILENGSLTNNYFWNNGLTIDDSILQLQLYRKNNLISSKEYRKVNWSVLNNGLNSKHWRVQNVQNENSGLYGAILMYDIEKGAKGYTNYIIKAQADLPIDEDKYQTYYNFYPICTDLKYRIEPQSYEYNIYDDNGKPIGKNEKIVYNNYYIGIDKNRTLRQVVYNSDGRNPLYNKNLGVGLTFKNLDYPRTITWEPHGGVILENHSDEIYPAFSIGKSVSYVTSSTDTVDNLLADIEYQKNKEINEKLQEQKVTAIDIIQNNIGETYNDLLTQKYNLDNNYNSLKSQRDTLWLGFLSQRKLYIENTYKKLSNLIDTYISSDWNIEDYITGKTYDVAGMFWADIIKYVEGKFDIDTPDDASYKQNISKTIITDLEQVLRNLVFNINVDENHIIEEEDADKIKQSFTTLINLIIVGHETQKTIYYKKHQELYSTIENIVLQCQELNINIEKYANALDILVNDIKRAEVVPIINKILFENSLEYALLNNELLLSIVLLVKTQFNDEIIAIETKYNSQLTFLTGITIDNSDPTFCSITPNEVYSGEYSNQYVKVKIYQGLLEQLDDKFLEHELIVPIHMSLNTYGLASLNAWDGNSVEINENEGYVLAPQIGAGVKHTEDNTFTGVLMGTEKTFDDTEGQEEIGLLGYSHGKRSIFLDATTGNATFGLPENDAADVSNPLTEGRIELRPGGTSSISKWNFDARSLYRVSTDDEQEAILQSRSYIQQNSKTSLGPPYEDAPLYAHGSIPHKKQGILLSALPAYASFKGRVLTKADQSEQRVNYLNSHTSVREGDTFELQIDPNDSRFFSLYEHSTRIYEGYGTCDTLAGYQEFNKYPMTDAEFNEYFDMFINSGANIFYNIDRDNTIILTQRYLKLNYNNEMRQVFRPLSYLYQQNDNWYWRIINSTVDKRNRETGEYVVATLSQYEDWQNNKDKRSTWRYITFKPIEENILKDIPVNIVYNNNELSEVSLLDNEIINDNTEVWHRYKKAGIDATGKFVVEGVGTGAVGLGLNDIQAFDTNSLFMGANFESENGSIIQFFIDKLSTQPTSPLFISSTKILTNDRNNDEGRRPIRVYAGRDSDNLSSGIFVGQSAKQKPEQAITKIELSQTSADDNQIVLAALGNDVETTTSMLTLKTSSEINNQIGSLKHTGNWITNIDGQFNGHVGNSSIIINKKSKDINQINSSGNFIGKINGKTLAITNNQFYLDNGNNILNLRNKDDNNTNQSVLLRGQYGVNIVGGYNNTSNKGHGTLIMQAINTSHGLLLATSYGTGSSTKIENSGALTVNGGDAVLRLLPAEKSNDARFILKAGSHSQIHDDIQVINKTYDAIVLTPHIKVGSSGTGQIQGNGTYISNTANWQTQSVRLNRYKKWNTGRTTYKENGKDVEYGFGANTSTKISGAGGSGSFYVPYITKKNGRPFIDEQKITIELPNAQNLSGYATTTQIAELKASLALLKLRYENHYHTLDTPISTKTNKPKSIFG